MRYSFGFKTAHPRRSVGLESRQVSVRTTSQSTSTKLQHFPAVNALSRTETELAARDLSKFLPRAVFFGVRPGMSNQLPDCLVFFYRFRCSFFRLVKQMIFGFLALDYVDWLQLFFICLILGLQRFKIRGDVCFLRLIKLVFSKIIPEQHPEHKLQKSNRTIRLRF